MTKINNKRKIIQLIMWPILFGIGQILVIVAMFLLLQMIKPISFVEFEVQDRLRTILFPATAFTFLIFFPLFYKKYRKENINHFQLKKLKMVYYSLFGVVTSFVINLFFIKLERMLPITPSLNRIEVIYDWFYIGRIISTAFIGPVLEELLFRGFLYQEAKKYMKNMRAIIFVTVLFTLCHTTIYSMLTALVTSFLVLDALEKEKSITGPILFHIFLNLTSILFIPLVIKYQTLWIDILFGIMLICFMMLYFLPNKKEIKE